MRISIHSEMTVVHGLHFGRGECVPNSGVRGIRFMVSASCARRPKRSDMSKLMIRRCAISRKCRDSRTAHLENVKQDHKIVGSGNRHRFLHHGLVRKIERGRGW
jgi:hypothetical protein